MGRSLDQDVTNAKISATWKQRWATMSEQQRASRLAVLRRASSTASTEARKAAWARLSDEARTARMKAVLASPATHEARSEGAKRRWARLTAAERSVACAAWAKHERRPIGAERRAAIGEASRRYWEKLTPEGRKAQIAPMLAAQSLTTRKGRRPFKPRSPAYRRAIGEAAKRRFASMTRTQRQAQIAAAQRTCRGRHDRMTGLELIVERLLTALGLVHIHQYAIDTYCVDFYLPDYRLVIECDGTYWHSLPGRAETDKRRDDRLRALNYQVIRLSESEISELSATALKGLIAC